MSDSATPWTAGCQAPLSMGFFKQEYWRCHYRLQGDLPDSGIEPASPVPSALAGRLFATKSSGKHAKYWISVGAQPTDIVKKLMNRQAAKKAE